MCLNCCESNLFKGFYWWWEYVITFQPHRLYRLIWWVLVCGLSLFQPALLYIVPAVIGFLASHCVWNGDIKPVCFLLLLAFNCSKRKLQHNRSFSKMLMGSFVFLCSCWRLMSQLRVLRKRLVRLMKNEEKVENEGLQSNILYT